MNQHSSYSAYYKHIAMLATNGSYYMPNSDLGTGRSSTLYYKPKYYTKQRIRVNYKVRPMHLPGLEEDDGSSSGGSSSGGSSSGGDTQVTERTVNGEEEEEEDNENEADIVEEEESDVDINDLYNFNEEELFFTEEDRDIARRGGGYEPDDNGRSPIYSELTQDGNMTLITDGDPQTEKLVDKDNANIKEVTMKNKDILEEFQERYGLSFNEEDHIHSDRLRLIKRIESVVLTIAKEKGASEKQINEVMFRVLGGNLNKIACQITLHKRLQEIEKYIEQEIEQENEQ